MREYKVEVSYIGGILSKNSYKFKNRGTKPEVKRWMRELEEKVRSSNIESLGIPFEVGVYGYFWDGRRPDLHNLFPVIADSLQRGLGINDKFFLIREDGIKLGYKEQRLLITIREKQDGSC